MCVRLGGRVDGGGGGTADRAQAECARAIGAHVVPKLTLARDCKVLCDSGD